MYRLLGEVLQFIIDVIKHWKALMTGGLIIVLVTLYERARGTLSINTVIFGTLILFVVAAFMAWRDRYRALKKIENARPDIKGKFKQVYIDLDVETAGSNNFDCYITIEMALWNANPTPTTIQEFRVVVITDHREYEVKQATLERILYWKSGSNEELNLDDFELSRHPLPDGYRQGLIEEGWLRFIFNVPLDNEKPGEFNIKRIVLIAIDTFETYHSIIGEPPWNQLGRVQKRKWDFV